uniref:Uncharacterized protein n=1 Tax=Falco tinnunculus TaxID=100819 RepID=A0A8C4UMV0_FALTI
MLHHQRHNVSYTYTELTTGLMFMILAWSCHSQALHSSLLGLRDLLSKAALLPSVPLKSTEDAKWVSRHIQRPPGLNHIM